MSLRIPSYEIVQLTLIACAITVVLVAFFGVEVLPLALCISVGIFLVLLPDVQRSQGESFLDQDGVTLYKAGSLPYALWLMDTPTGMHAGITAYNAGGVTGILITDAGPAVTWAYAQYRQYREQAQEILMSEM